MEKEQLAVGSWQPAAQRRLLLHFLFSVILAVPAFAQKTTTRILFVFDASNSMNAFWNTRPKIQTARDILLKSLQEIENTPDLEIGLRLYGHQTRIEPGKQDCDDTKLEVPIAPHSSEAIRRVMTTVQCLGTTPIARSLEKAANDFPPQKNTRNIIILITDGIEACDEDPCAVSRALQAQHIILKPFVIGIGLDGAVQKTFECVGNYYDASTEQMFDHVLKIVIGQALNNTTSELDLLDDDSKPTETDVPVTFYDQKTGALRYHFVHTLNIHGQPDTLSIDPLFTYRVVAHTVPPSTRENVTVKPGEHTIVTVVAGRGDLELKVGGGYPDANGMQCIVRRTGEGATLDVQPMNSKRRYRTGSYDLEILTLPRTLIPGVVIKQDETTNIAVPQAGILNLQFSTPGDGGLFVKDGSELHWVAALDPKATNMLFRLQPGDYQVVYRSVNSRQTIYSIQKDATVLSDRTITLNF